MSLLKLNRRITHFFRHSLPIRTGCLLLLSTLLMACASAYSSSYRTSLPPNGFSGNQYMHTRLLGSIAISSGYVNNIPIVELSDLAWDKRSETLYAISDNGYLYTMKIKQSANKLLSAKIINAVRLTGANQKVLKGANNDPEGLDIVHKRNRSELIISFERNSRVARYSTQGKYLGRVRIPRKLTSKTTYRHRNKALESVAVHPKYGVITASEYPLKASPRNTQTIYSQYGKEWHFPRYPAKKSAITALEVLDNGDILILERAFSGFFQPLVISIRQLQLNRCNRKNHCAVKDIAVFSSADGWSVDNFEGLTQLSANRYLMISDDNKNPLQRTLLVMFDVIP
ncbi:MAG: hypothetical protein CSB47_00335 [Proteobacteria bacterium]|nr:MAG: hypothetical protein CSB47_00335 [Pseudomonadota bacterium]